MKLTFWLALCFVVLAIGAFALDPRGENPTVTVTEVKAEPCGVECSGVKVTWSTKTPKGATITGYKVEVVPPSSCPGCFSPISAVNAPASATSAVVGITSAGSLPPGTYTAKVTANFTASLTASKGQNL